MHVRVFQCYHSTRPAFRVKTVVAHLCCLRVKRWIKKRKETILHDRVPSHILITRLPWHQALRIDNGKYKFVFMGFYFPRARSRAYFYLFFFFWEKSVFSVSIENLIIHFSLSAYVH